MGVGVKEPKRAKLIRTGIRGRHGDNKTTFAALHVW